MHRHKWTVKEKTILPSPFEQVATQVDGTLKADGVTAVTFFHKDCVVHYACGCGAEKVTRV